MNREMMYNLLRAGKIKGHTRIILEDTKGHRIIKEDHNMVTNALAKIFESNYHGIVDFHAFEPIKQLVGGVYLFWNQLTESADFIYPPSQNQNKLTANAGQTPHYTADPTRGNPNGMATVIDPANGRVKFVWDWSLEQGVGQISAAALTHQNFGDAGLYPSGDLPLAIGNTFEINNVNRFSELATGTGYDEIKSLRFPLTITSIGTGLCVWVSGSTFKENTVRHPWVKPSLIEGCPTNSADNYTVLSTRTATLTRSFTEGYTFVAQDDSNYYVMERDSSVATKLYVDVVDKSDMTVTNLTLNITETLARPSANNGIINNGIVSGGFIYWVSGADSSTLVRIDMTTPANTDVLSSSVSEALNLKAQPIVLSDELIVGRNFFVNGDYIYPIASRLDTDATADSTETIAQYISSPFRFSMPNTVQNYSQRYLVSGGVLVPYLATVNNLEGDPVVKQNNQTMRCEYTLTFTEAV